MLSGIKSELENSGAECVVFSPGQSFETYEQEEFLI